MKTTTRTWDEQLKTLNETLTEAQQDGDKLAALMVKAEIRRVEGMGELAWTAEGWE